jgi:general secretion pathway protein B
MSYILDALRRADAERQRGQVPGIGATAAGSHVPARAVLPARARLALWLGLFTLISLVFGGLALWLLRQQAPQAPLAAAARAEVAPPPAQVAPQAVPPALPVVVSAQPSAPPSASPATPPLPAPTEPQQAIPQTAAPATGPAPRPRRLGELTAEQRAGLPPLAVGGAVWSEIASNRLLILDGQVLREGQAVATGLVLLQIRPKSALLRWRDIVFELPV